MKVYRTDIFWNVWDPERNFQFGSVIGWEENSTLKFLLVFRTALSEKDAASFAKSRDSIAKELIGDNPLPFMENYFKDLLGRAIEAKVSDPKKVIWRLHKEFVYSSIHSPCLLNQEFPDENLIEQLEHSLAEIPEPKKSVILTMADANPHTCCDSKGKNG